MNDGAGRFSLPCDGEFPVARRRGIAVDAARKSAADLAFKPPRDAGEGLDCAWQALFLGYLALAAGEPSIRELAAVSWLASVDALSRFRFRPSLLNGFLGIAWVTEHLRSLWAADGDPNETIDAVILDGLQRRSLGCSFDLVDGLVGIGVYALERPPGTAADEILDLVATALAENAVMEDSGAFWHNSSGMPDVGETYLGLSHGTAGVIALLASLHRRSGLSPTLEDLLRASVCGLRSWRQREDPYTCFPRMAGTKDVPPSRTAWCHGDAGIARALYRAGTALADEDVVNEAIEVALIAATRSDSLTGVRDPGLCHGSSGLALIYSRFFRDTGHKVFATAEHHWRDWTDRFIHRSAGPVDAPGCSAILDGAAGYGLVGLSDIADGRDRAGPDPSWDRVLLVS